MPFHILLCGDRGVGKSTLIQRLLAENTRPVYGFCTKRLDADETGFHPLYIYPAEAAVRRETPENRIGECDSRTHSASPEVFNTLGTSLIERARPGGILVMDELGFLEARAERFTAAVLRALAGEIPVLAAVKNRFDVPFLNEVRAQPRARVYAISAENREALYRELLPVIRGWNRTPTAGQD